MPARIAAFGLAALAAAAVHAGPLNLNVRTPQGAPVGDAVIWLEGAAKPGAAPAEIAQRDQEFEPFVTVISTGSRVTFPNRDKVKHHVYSFSPAKTFEIQLYSGTPTEPITFDKPGVVVMGCNIHDWMLAYVAVVDSAWYAKTDAKGAASLATAPPGHYVLHVWHPYQTTQLAPQPVDIAAGASNLPLTLALAVPPRKPRTSSETY